MFEIWEHVPSRRRYLIVVRDDQVWVAAGPLDPTDDPRRVLETRGNPPPNSKALLQMHRAPEAYRREYTTGADGRAVRGPAPSEPTE